MLFFAAPFLARAAAAADEAPAEQASPITVILFLVLFVGACVAYVGYAWWNRKKED
jgi:flagellar basal body-associated protein FliL